MPAVTSEVAFLTASQKPEELIKDPYFFFINILSKVALSAVFSSQVVIIRLLISVHSTPRFCFHSAFCSGSITLVSNSTDTNHPADI